MIARHTCIQVLIALLTSSGVWSASWAGLHGCGCKAFQDAAAFQAPWMPSRVPVGTVRSVCGINSLGMHGLQPSFHLSPGRMDSDEVTRSIFSGRLSLGRRVFSTRGVAGLNPSGPRQHARVRLEMVAKKPPSGVKKGYKGGGAAKGGWGGSVGVKEDAFLPQDEGLFVGALSNGMRYSIKRNSMPPGRFFANLVVHVGSVDETDDQQGIAHYLEHMLFLGTEAYPNPDAMHKILGKLGMSQLADANAYTDFRSTVYTLSAPTRGEDQRRFHDTNSACAANRDTLFRLGLLDTPVTIQTLQYEEGDEEEDQDWDNDAYELTSGEAGGNAAGGIARDDRNGKSVAGESEGSSNVGTVIELLHQMAFKALIRQKNVDSERGAILSEYRDTKDLSDRVASKYYKQMFEETVLPLRFPIGKERLIKTFSAAEIRTFYERHYFPANLHLVVVGDVDPAETLANIENFFGQEPAGPAEGLPDFDARDYPTPEGMMCSWPLRGSTILHDFGARIKRPFEIVTHTQITDFTFTLTVKEPMKRNNRVRHFREGMLDTLACMALGYRTDVVVEISDDPPFTSVDWHYFKSAREGCVLNSITVSSEQETWRWAILEGMKEVRRLCRFGISLDEHHMLESGLMGDYKKAAEQERVCIFAVRSADALWEKSVSLRPVEKRMQMQWNDKYWEELYKSSMPRHSGEIIEEVLESLETGSSFMSARQAYDTAIVLQPTITLDAVNARIKQIYSYAEDPAAYAIFITAPPGWGQGVGEDDVRRIIQESVKWVDSYVEWEPIPAWLQHIRYGWSGTRRIRVGNGTDLVYLSELDVYSSPSRRRQS